MPASTRKRRRQRPRGVVGYPPRFTIYDQYEPRWRHELDIRAAVKAGEKAAAA